MTPLIDRIEDLSRAIHDAIYDDASMSMCGRAYDLQGVSWFWWAWVRVCDLIVLVLWFTPDHCRRSWLWHCEAHWPGSLDQPRPGLQPAPQPVGIPCGHHTGVYSAAP
jgi:hypothetical protein